MKQVVTMEKLVNLCKGRGFVFAGSEIYGGMANAWDYGPLGVELKNNIKKAWWKKFVEQSPLNVGLDCAILMNPSVWKASGHLDGFSDPLMDCKSCRSRHRADNLIENYISKKELSVNAATMTQEQMEKFIAENTVNCPVCGKNDFTSIRKFNLMFKTFVGVTEDSANTAYMRPETAQGIFVNFKNVQRTSRRKIPFGIGQIGKSFRNEITPGNFIFRTREFEQMELEFFCEPGTDLEWFDYWKNFCIDWLKNLGIRPDMMRVRDHEKDELSHYSKATSDIEFLFPFGWGELWGIADRTDFDLLCHQNASGVNMEYIDPVDNAKRFVPYCIEPSLGVERLLLAILSNAYCEEVVGENDTRIVMKFAPTLAPFKVVVLPLQKKLSEKSEEILANLSKHFSVDYDESGSIGKRYRRQDEIGTPICLTVDFQTLEDNTVTLRDRDSMEQIRLPVEEVVGYINKILEF